jgi:hypothetical protein
MDSRAHKPERLLIAAFLLFQLAMPLRYYLGGGGTDERFSWRMFSSVRMQKCDVNVRETIVRNGKPAQQTVDLGREMQVAWVGMLERYRPTVVDKFLRRRCEQARASSVRYLRKCTNTDGSQSAPLAVEINCTAGTIDRPKDAP